MSYAQIANVFQYLHRELPASANNKGVWEQGILTNANYLHRDLLTSANNKEVWEQNDGRYWNKIPFDIPYAHIANVFHYLHRDLLTSANNKGVWESDQSSFLAVSLNTYLQYVPKPLYYRHLWELAFFQYLHPNPFIIGTCKQVVV